MEPRIVRDTVVEPRAVLRTEMVPQERSETVQVPRTVETTRVVETTVMETVHETVHVPRTVMEPRCVQDCFEETRVLRFDPASGEQIALDGRPLALGAQRSAAAPPPAPDAAAPARGGVGDGELRDINSAGEGGAEWCTKAEFDARGASERWDAAPTKLRHDIERELDERQRATAL
eukprot:gene12598-16401_t